MNALDRYLIKAPEIIFEWKDPESEAIGWVVINSLKGGAAGGGTRMRKGLTKTEVVELAKTMEVKFNVCGPGIGGAKSGINFDPNDPRKKEVLSRWFKVISPLLKTYYGTAGDLNVDERLEVSPMLQEIGIMHPQQGVLTGHYALNAEKSALRLNRLKQGTSLLLTNPNFAPFKAGSPYSTADIITGFGVYSAIKAYYQQISSSGIKDKRFFIQGWGNVGAAAGWYLSRDGGKIVLIQDRNSYYLNEREHPLKILINFYGKKGKYLAPGTRKGRPTSCIPD
ncbi:MAG: hypothetical protein IPM92_04835 [Saprospiraceae bacterium]|nr:hypothetical protein [Saprospiraceae bacterium]